MVTVLYFASFQDAAGMDSELVDKPGSLISLYERCKQKYHFKLQVGHIRVAVNGVFVNWQDSISDGDEIAFIPPVSGG